jgi:hypothetical protein
MIGEIKHSVVNPSNDLGKYIVCDGQQYDTSRYKELYEIIKMDRTPIISIEDNNPKTAGLAKAWIKATEPITIEDITGGIKTLDKILGTIYKRRR